jgi:anaerobic glycerol-3-phosphate dehydrogenase
MNQRADATVAIVGAGVAALAAALAVRHAGATPRVIGGPRGLSHLASGVWDQGGDASAPPALRPRWSDARKIAQRAVLGALGGYRAVPFRDEDRPLVATQEGTTRRVLSAERCVLDLAHAPRARTAVVGLAALPLPSATSLARALDEDAVRRGDLRRFFAVEAEHARRAHDLLLGPSELAHANEPAAARHRLVEVLRRAVGELPCDAILLPPILGASGESVVAHLERALGKPVGEVVAARSIQSERLTRKLEQALDAIDPARVRADATSLARSESSVVVEVGPHHVTAGAVVLCTGRELAGGLRGGHLALLPAEAPRGASVDARSRITSHGAVVSERVLGAGSLLEGLDPAEGIGLGAIAASGWIAGAEAARLAR